MRSNIRNILFFIFSITFFCFIYIGVFKISVGTICILLVFFALYGCFFGFSWKSMEKLKKYEQKLIHIGLNKEDDRKILLFSLTALSPMLFCVFLVSCVPLFSYEVWFITVFPCICLNCLPVSSVLEEYHGLTRKKLPFLLSFLFLTAICCFTGVVTTHLFFM